MTNLNQNATGSILSMLSLIVIALTGGLAGAIDLEPLPARTGVGAGRSFGAFIARDPATNLQVATYYLGLRDTYETFYDATTGSILAYQIIRGSTGLILMPTGLFFDRPDCQGNLYVRPFTLGNTVMLFRSSAGAQTGTFYKSAGVANVVRYRSYLNDASSKCTNSTVTDPMRKLMPGTLTAAPNAPITLSEPLIIQGADR